MLVAPPSLLKFAREFLGLRQEQVVALSGVSRRTIQRVEEGDVKVFHFALKLQHFYEKSGIEFLAPTSERGWGIINNNTREDPQQLNQFDDLERSAPEADSQIGHKEPKRSED